MKDASPIICWPRLFIFSAAFSLASFAGADSSLPLGTVTAVATKELQVTVRYHPSEADSAQEVVLTFEDKDSFEDYPTGSIVYVDPATKAITPCAAPLCGHFSRIEPLTARSSLPILSPGEALPDVELKTSSGQSLKLSALQGTPLLVLFVDARSPVGGTKTLSKKAASVQKALKSNKAPGHILSVTLDPEHDTEDDLAALAKTYGAEDEVWIFATGTKEDIHRLGDALGLVVFGHGGTFSYTLSGAIIRPDGALDQFVRGTRWSNEAVAARLLELGEES